MATIQCGQCGLTKADAEFYRNKGSPLSRCKECVKTNVRARYAANRERMAAYDRSRRDTPERKAQRSESQRRRKNNRPERERARWATSNAIRDGRLVRQPCEVCGSDESQAHHDDYSKPLDVRWLCFVHHREHHGQTVTDVTYGVRKTGSDR